MTGPAGAVVASGLTKSYGTTRSLAGVSFEAPAGTVLGLLGPNGAGKTTTVRILSTLVRADGGFASVLGHDVARQPAAVRAVVGLAGQYAAVDERLTGRQNLRLVAGLYRMSRPAARRRADELLERFGLEEAADRQVGFYSGGMRRRLDLAASLVNEPAVLYLDEPTTGLDPPGRLAIWQAVQDLVAAGTTVLLTTQYLEEADRLCHSLVVIDHGRVIARGTPGQLKAQIGGDVIELVVTNANDTDRAAAVIGGAGSSAPSLDPAAGRVVLPVGARGPERLGAVVRLLSDAHIAVDAIGVRQATLDEVFLALTGGEPPPEPPPPPAAGLYRPAQQPPPLPAFRRPVPPVFDPPVRVERIDPHVLRGRR